MRSITLNLPHEEFEVLESLMRKKDMSKTGVLRQALRLYQLVDARLGEDKTIVINGERYVCLS